MASIADYHSVSTRKSDRHFYLRAPVLSWATSSCVAGHHTQTGKVSTTPIHTYSGGNRTTAVSSTAPYK